jgi:hypothetical protein
MTKRLAAAAALGLCTLPAAMAQQTQQSPTPAQPPPAQQPAQQPQPTQQQGTPQSPARPGYYQFPQSAPPAPAPGTPQYPRYYQYPQNAPPAPPPPQYVAAKPVNTEPLVHWHIDGGWSEPAGRNSNYLQGGYSAGLGFSVALGRGSPLDLRFDANYDRNDATQRLIGLNQNSSDSINRGREEIWSGTLDLEMHLPLGGGSDLYFFGGGGVYNVTLSFDEPLSALGGYYGGGYYCDPFQEFCGGGFGDEVRAASQTFTKLGWNAGVGLQGPIGGGAKWFLEGRYNRVQNSHTVVPLAFIPITVGLRF